MKRNVVRAASRLTALLLAGLAVNFGVRAGNGGAMIEFRGICGHLDITSITHSGAVAGVATIMGKRTTNRKK